MATEVEGSVLHSPLEISGNEQHSENSFRVTPVLVVTHIGAVLLPGPVSSGCPSFRRRRNDFLTRRIAFEGHVVHVAEGVGVLRQDRFVKIVEGGSAPVHTRAQGLEGYIMRGSTNGETFAFDFTESPDVVLHDLRFPQRQV